MSCFLFWMLTLATLTAETPGQGDRSSSPLIPLVEIQKQADGGYQGQVVLMDAQGITRQVVTSPGHPFVADIPGTDQVLIGSGTWDRNATSSISEWDLKTGKLVKTIKHPRSLLLYNQIGDIQGIIPISMNDGILWLLTSSPSGKSCP